MKRIISIAVALFVMATLLAVPAFAASTMSFALATDATSDTIHPGDEIVVSINATSETGVEAAQFDLTYDASKLTYKADSVTFNVFKRAIKNLSGNSVDGNVGKLTAKIATNSAYDVYEGEEIVTFTFTAKADLDATAVTNLSLAISQLQDFDYNPGTCVTPITKAITIEVESAATPNVASVGAIADAYVLAGTDYATAKASFPATAAATFDDDSTANVNVTWPETLTYAAAGEYVTVTGAIAASDAYTNTGSVAPSFKLYTIPETVAITIDGLDPAAVASKVGTAANVALTYDFADGVAEFAYVVTNEEDTASAPTDDAAWSTAKTFSFAADDAHGTVKKVTAFVKIGDEVVASTSGTILKCNTIASGTVYVNATVANPTFSALRVNKAAGFTATSAFKYANDAEHSFVGTTTYALYPKFGAAQDVAVATNTDGTFDDIAALANGAYTVKATYTEEGFETIEATRTANIGSVGLWYSAFTINDKTATQNIKATATNKINFTVDTMDGLDVIYTGAAIVPYGDVVADKALTETASVASEYVLDFAGLTGRTYSVYALAKKDNTQPYYDFALAKTVYLKDAYTNAYSVSYNGTGYCDAGHQDAITFAARCAGPQLAVGTVTYEYTFEKWDAEAGAFVAATVNDTETVLTDDATNAGVTVTNGTTAFGKKNRVTLTVKLNGEIDNVIQKIFYN